MTHISEVDQILGELFSKRTRDGIGVGEDMVRKVDVEAEDGSVMKISRCKDFEALQLLNLMPRSAEEAAVIIPTLRENEFLDELVSDLDKHRQKDKGINPWEQ